MANELESNYMLPTMQKAGSLSKLLKRLVLVMMAL